MTRTRDELLARIQELEEQNSELAETLERINDLSADPIEDEADEDATELD